MWFTQSSRSPSAPRQAGSRAVDGWLSAVTHLMAEYVLLCT